MASARIRKGDEVIAIAGKDKGRRGYVTEICKDGRIVVEGLNVAKKHVKPNPQEGVQGGIVEKDMPMQLSNVMLYNPLTEKGDRVGFKFLEDGGKQRKVRYFKSNGEVVDA